jgi:hypothetical protein
VAKCIQTAEGVIRATDDEAFQIVDRDKRGEYCSKSLWRGAIATRTAIHTPVRTAALLILVAGKAKFNRYVD